MTANSRSLVDKEFVKKESDYYFQALEDSIVLKIERVEDRECLSHPCWQEIFAKEIERVHTIEERRIKQLLLADAETRYFNFLQDFPGLEGRIKQSHIASYVGVSPVSLSRIRTHIKSN
jgi:CRP-like cAMP-binding protein